jgi:hypothetical protein
MTRHWLWGLISLNLLVLLSLVFVYPNLMVSPGALAPAHATLAKDCFACHAPFRGAAADRCIACHALQDIGVRTTKGIPISQASAKASFHQELIEQDCMACHVDHLTTYLDQISLKPFSHALLRASVRDRCETCHTAPSSASHRQFTGNCGQCHGSRSWKPATFDHDKLFVLDKDHNAVCTTCHVNDDYSHYTCYGCHEHQIAQIREKNLDEGIQNFQNCVQCHRSAHEKSGD